MENRKEYGQEVSRQNRPGLIWNKEQWIKSAKNGGLKKDYEGG